MTTIYFPEIDECAKAEKTIEMEYGENLSSANGQSAAM